MMNPTTIQFTGRHIKQEGFSTIKVYMLRDFSVVALIGCQEAIVTCGTITMAPRHGFCDLEHARGNLLRNLSISSSSHWGTPKICAHYGKCPEPYRPVNGLLLTPLNPLQSFVQMWWAIPWMTHLGWWWCWRCGMEWRWCVWSGRGGGGVCGVVGVVVVCVEW